MSAVTGQARTGRRRTNGCKNKGLAWSAAPGRRPKTSVQTKTYWETRVSFNLALTPKSEESALTYSRPRSRKWQPVVTDSNAKIESRPENGHPTQGKQVRDQYTGDVSEVLKFAFLRALAGADRTLGVAWYYAPGDDGRADGRHLEWRDEPAWRLLDAQLHAGLSTLPERSIAALERAMIWPSGALFHRDPMPHSCRARRVGSAQANSARRCGYRVSRPGQWPRRGEREACDLLRNSTAP